MDKNIRRAFGLCVLLLPVSVLADGNVVDKVYHPYVQPLEQELEWRMVAERDDGEHDRLHRFGYGKSLNDRWFAEVYLVGEDPDHDGFDLDAWELETKWQITEQGEYWADWGLLFELERETRNNVWELSTTILAEKEWGRWSSTANFSIKYEWGSGIDEEFETALAVQQRYRLSRLFEPALELYSGQDSKGIGPAALGSIRMGGRKQLLWEAGVIFAIDGESPNQTIRLSLEFEF